jgi:hypothetical protein
MATTSQKISGGTVFFYILGRADYNDSFARVPPHITDFAQKCTSISAFQELLILDLGLLKLCATELSTVPMKNAISNVRTAKPNGPT